MTVHCGISMRGFSEDGWISAKLLDSGASGFVPQNYMVKEDGKIESEE